MANDNNNPKKSKGSKELSELFIDEHGRLSVWIDDNECEVIGFQSNIFADGFLCMGK
jgi:hypothetical protein